MTLGKLCYTSSSRVNLAANSYQNEKMRVPMWNCLFLVAMHCALSQPQSMRNKPAPFPCAVILTAFAGIMSGLTLGLVRCFDRLLDMLLH